MNNNVACMVDLETLGISHGAPIITIGAVLFDPTRCDSVSYHRAHSFYRRVDLTDALKNSEGADPSTIAWWFGQSDAAIKEVIQPGLSLQAVLKDFITFCTDRRPTKLMSGYPEDLHEWARPTTFWAKSPDFDGKMLEYAFRRFDLPNPFRYDQYRCVRTIQDLAWPNGPGDRPTFDVGTAHNAVDDAVSQTLMVQAGYLKLGLSREPEAVFTNFNAPQ